MCGCVLTDHAAQQLSAGLQNLHSALMKDYSWPQTADTVNTPQFYSHFLNIYDMITKMKRNVQSFANCAFTQDIQSDQKVSVHLMITIQKVTSNVQSLAANRQGQGDTRLTLTPSVVPNSNYVIMVSD
jgi:hypothetical protein